MMNASRAVCGTQFLHILPSRLPWQEACLHDPSTPVALTWCQTHAPASQCMCGQYALLWVVPTHPAPAEKGEV